MFFFKPDKTERRRWLVGFALVLMMHAGFAAAVSGWQVAPADGGGPLDAVMIDMVAVAPAVRDNALPPAPKKVAHKPVSIPKLKPQAKPDSAVLPEVELEPELLSELNPELQPELKQEQVDEQDVAENEVDENEVAEQQLLGPSTAPPAHDVAEAEIATSPSAISGATQAAVATWQGRMVAHLQKHKRYPRAARIQRDEGSAHVRFTLDRAGKVLATEIVSSSGSQRLDRASLALLARAQPLPAPPKDYGGETFELIVPIDYFIR